MACILVRFALMNMGIHPPRSFGASIAKVAKKIQGSLPIIGLLSRLSAPEGGFDELVGGQAVLHGPYTIRHCSLLNQVPLKLYGGAFSSCAIVQC